MDYQYAGCASYPRFDRELYAIVKIFGGTETKYLKEIMETEVKNSAGYWFGFLSSADPKETKFIFPEGTNEILVKWFNDIYNKNFTPAETKIICENIFEHPEIKELSSQIWAELKILYKENESWYIY